MSLSLVPSLDCPPPRWTNPVAPVMADGARARPAPDERCAFCGVEVTTVSVPLADGWAHADCAVTHALTLMREAQDLLDRSVRLGRAFEAHQQRLATWKENGNA